MQKTLDLRVKGQEFALTSAENGLFDLSQAWKFAKGDLIEHPMMWDEGIVDYYLSKGDLVFPEGNSNEYLATTKGLYIYLAWLCPDFSDCVFKCFDCLVEG